MSDKFFIADPHFDHYNVVLHCFRWPWMSPNPNYDPSKPKNIKTNWPWLVALQDHNDALVERWNDMVGSKGTTYILGDFAWKNHMRHFARLKGKKILITGNHDKMNGDCLKNFTEVHEWGCMREMGLGTLNEKGREKRVLLCMTHCAQMVWPSSHYGSWHIYGHSHGRLPEWTSRLAFDVGVDTWGYQPVPLEAVAAKMQKKIDAMKAVNADPRDGESPAFGRTPGNAEERVLAHRKENLQILKDLGIPVKYGEIGDDKHVGTGEMREENELDE